MRIRRVDVPVGAAASPPPVRGGPPWAERGGCAEPVAAAVGVDGPGDADGEDEDEGVLEEDLLEMVVRKALGGRGVDEERADERQDQRKAEVFEEAGNDQAATTQ